uniref:Ribonuclease 3-like protein 2 n=1 Tax=Anthurium amnicola TaxID=1678845 RepID=A0A1D1YIY7_9ARAE
MKPPAKRMGRSASSDQSSVHASSSSSSSSSSKTVSDYRSSDPTVGVEEDGLADSRMAASIAALECLLGYPFRNPRLAEEALTHPSAAQRRPSYQRLEFVGDAVLGLAVALHLYHTNPGEGPGRLTLLRSANVSTEKLARAALRHGLYEHLRRSAPQLDGLVADFAAAVAREEDEDAQLAAIYGGVSVRAPKVLADVVESVVAAVFVDTGFDLGEMWRVCHGLLVPIITADTFHDQPVAALTKLCQQRGWALDFNNWRKGDRAVANAFINGKLLGIGSSDQKHIAKLNAARDALREISRAIREAEADATETEEELGIDSGGGVVIPGGDEMVGGEEISIDDGDVTGAEDSNMALESKGEADEICGKNDSTVMGRACPEEELEGAKKRLYVICGKNHWSNPVYRVLPYKVTSVRDFTRTFGSAQPKRPVGDLSRKSTNRVCVRVLHA